MSDIKKASTGEKELTSAAREIGSLVVKKGFSYNQTKKLFDFVLEQLKDIPFQSENSGKE